MGANFCLSLRGMKAGMAGFDLQAHKATIFDSGDSQFSTTTLPTIGQAVRSIMHHPDETANKFVYVASVTTSQNGILKALEQATGRKWEVEHASMAERAKTGQEKLRNGDIYPGVIDLIQASVFDERRGANYAKTRGLGNEMLGLPEETLEGMVKALLE